MGEPKCWKLAALMDSPYPGWLSVRVPWLLPMVPSVTGCDGVPTSCRLPRMRVAALVNSTVTAVWLLTPLHAAFASRLEYVSGLAVTVPVPAAMTVALLRLANPEPVLISEPETITVELLAWIVPELVMVEAVSW